MKRPANPPLAVLAVVMLVLTLVALGPYTPDMIAGGLPWWAVAAFFGSLIYFWVALYVEDRQEARRNRASKLLSAAGRSPSLRERSPYDYRSLVSAFTHDGITLQYIALDAELDFLNLALSAPRHPEDDALIRQRDWRFARILGLRPTRNGRLYDAWLREMHERNGLTPATLIHPKMRAAMMAAPEELVRWTRVISGGPTMGDPGA